MPNYICATCGVQQADTDAVKGHNGLPSAEGGSIVRVFCIAY